ncbi:MAG: AraC family transcriptional regulator [Clostridia bacterium]|nr:AraC family transcriptional regulator [Clostridia bacterium]
MKKPAVASNRFYYIANRRAASLYVCTVGYERYSQQYLWGPGSRPYYLMHYVASGSGVCEVGGEKHTIERGDAFICYPDCQFSVKSDASSRWEYYWVGFSGSEANVLVGRLGFSRTSPVIQIGTEQVYRQLYMDIFTERGPALSHSTAMTGRLYLLFSHLLEKTGEKGDVGDKFQLALDYINDNFGKKLTPNDVCRATGVSGSWLYRLFMKRMGISPGKYIAVNRIDASTMFLINTRMTISEIAYKVGYDDPLYYSRVFKQMMGLSPSEYRKSHAVDEMI